MAEETKAFGVAPVSESDACDPAVPAKATLSPFLLRALTELNKLAHEEKKAVDSKEAITENLVHLERIMAEKLAEIRAQLDRL